MPASRKSRETLKRGSQGAAAEWRLRAEMGAELSPPEARISQGRLTRLAAQQAALLDEFRRMKAPGRRERASDFKLRLRQVSVSAEAFREVWDSKFAPLLGEGTRSRHRGPRTPGSQRNQAHRAQADPERAARALDVKLRANKGVKDIDELIRRLNGDKHFLDAFGRKVTAVDIHKGLETLGEYRGKPKRTKTQSKQRRSKSV